MTMPVLLALGACVLLCLVLEAFFSGSETAIVSADRAQLRSAARTGDRRASLAERLLDRAETLLATTLVGTNLAVVTGTSLATLVVHDLVGRWGLGIDSGTATILVMTPLILVFGEILPKSIARGNAHAMTLRVAQPLAWAQRVMRPLVALASRLTELALALAGSKPTAESPYVSREELKALAEIGEEHGVLESDERRMIQSILELRERPVSMVMVPLIDMATLDITSSVAELEELVARTGFSRFPVHEERVDNVVGIVALTDLLRAGPIGDPSATSIAALVRQGATFVPETKSVGELLQELRYSDTPMAIVVDEHGGVAGLATAEDLVAEIIGRVRDERRPGPHAVAAEDGSAFECDGKMDVEEFAERTGIDVGRGGFETVAGLISTRAGRIPQAGETLDLGTWRAEVLDASPRHVRRLRFVRK